MHAANVAPAYREAQTGEAKSLRQIAAVLNGAGRTLGGDAGAEYPSPGLITETEPMASRAGDCARELAADAITLAPDNVPAPARIWRQFSRGRRLPIVSRGRIAKPDHDH